jgi:hypothetical protein
MPQAKAKGLIVEVLAGGLGAHHLYPFKLLDIGGVSMTGKHHNDSAS